MNKKTYRDLIREEIEKAERCSTNKELSYLLDYLIAKAKVVSQKLAERS